MRQFAFKVLQIAIFVGVTGWCASIGGQGYAPAVFGLAAAFLATMLIVGLSELWRLLILWRDPQMDSLRRRESASPRLGSREDPKLRDDLIL